MKYLVAAILMCVSFFAMAEDEPALKIDGNMELGVLADGDINASIGKDSIATQSIGAVESGDLEGQFAVDVQAGGDINAAIGDGACADQQIGTIGKKSSC
jgi:hypothetical protein